MIFNGIDLSPYLRIKEIHGRGISPSELTLIDVPAMDGAYYSQKRRPPRVIELKLISERVIEKSYARN